jgi:hypothetical protein
MKLALPALIAMSVLSPGAFAQDQVVEREAKGPPDKDIRVGLYVNVNPDCTSGPLPTIRLVGEPKHGKVTVRKANVNATNFKQCLALQVPGYVALYRARPGFSGADLLILEVRIGNKTQVQKITVTVGSPDNTL